MENISQKKTITKTKRGTKPNRTVFVGGLDIRTKEEDLIPYFSNFGIVKKLTLNRKKSTDKFTLGYGWLKTDQETFTRIISQKDHFFQKRKIDCKAFLKGAKKKEQEEAFRRKRVLIRELPSEEEISIQELTIFFKRFGRVENAYKLVSSKSGKVDNQVVVLFKTQEEAKKCVLEGLAGRIQLKGKVAKIKASSVRYVLEEAKKWEKGEGSENELKKSPKLSSKKREKKKKEEDKKKLSSNSSSSSSKGQDSQKSKKKNKKRRNRNQAEYPSRKSEEFKKKETFDQQYSQINEEHLYYRIPKERRRVDFRHPSSFTTFDRNPQLFSETANQLPPHLNNKKRENKFRRSPILRTNEGNTNFENVQMKEISNIQQEGIYNNETLITNQRQPDLGSSISEPMRPVDDHCRLQIFSKKQTARIVPGNNQEVKPMGNLYNPQPNMIHNLFYIKPTSSLFSYELMSSRHKRGNMRFNLEEGQFNKARARINPR